MYKSKAPTKQVAVKKAPVKTAVKKTALPVRKGPAPKKGDECVTRNARGFDRARGKRRGYGVLTREAFSRAQ